MKISGLGLKANSRKSYFVSIILMTLYVTVLISYDYNQDLNTIDDDIVENKSIINTPFNTLDFNWCEKLKQETEFRKNLNTHRNNLSIMLSNVDYEICDIEHYIEFTNFSASEGYKLSKLLKEKRELRRKIKDEIYIVNIFYRDWINGNNAENIYRAIESKTKRQYTPRALGGLFEKEELYDKT